MSGRSITPVHFLSFPPPRGVHNTTMHPCPPPPPPTPPPVHYTPWPHQRDGVPRPFVPYRIVSYRPPPNTTTTDPLHTYRIVSFPPNNTTTTTRTLAPSNSGWRPARRGGEQGAGGGVVAPVVRTQRAVHPTANLCAWLYDRVVRRNEGLGIHPTALRVCVMGWGGG